MEVVKTNIPLRDVSKVMREVGYNVSTPNRNSAIADQISEAEARPKKTLDDVINASMAKITPTRSAVVLPKSAPVKLASVVQEKKKDIKDSDELLPTKLIDDDLNFIEEEKKTVLIDMSLPETKITFTGPGWIPRDINRINLELVRAFKMKIRDEYRKGIK